MKLTDKVINQFNQPDTILVLSKYPYQDISHSHHGVAKYTEQTLKAVVDYTNGKQKFVVLVQNEYNRTPQLEANGNILVVPAFDQSPEQFLQIFNAIRKFNKINTIHIHSEFYTSGDIVQMGLTIPFLKLLQLTGKTTYYIAHNVVDDLSFLAKHLGTQSKSLKYRLMQLGLPIYYKMLGKSVDYLIALDESIKQRLSQFVSPDKIILSPLWVSPAETNNKRSYWRKKWGYGADDMVLICFGFMTRYKGVDWLVDTIDYLRKNNHSNIHLILAGGKAPSQTGKKHYESFYTALDEKAHNTPGVTLTGFIPDEELERYFAVADLAVLPYRGILGASASWGTTLEYGTPFILSKDLEPYLENDEVQSTLENNGLNKNELIFTRNRRSFASLLTKLTKKKLASLTRVANDIAEIRSPENQLQTALQTIYSTNEASDSLEWSYAQNLKKLVAKVRA